jgi:uncharacterized protein (TIGR02246 family)
MVLAADPGAGAPGAPCRGGVMAVLRRLGLLAALLAGGCAHWSGARARQDAEVRAAVAAANADFSSALKDGDARGMAAVFTEDGELMPSTQRAFVTGRAELEAYFAKRLEGRHFLEVEVATVQLGVSGDLAWESGTSRITLRQGETTAPVLLAGRYLAVWRRDADGRWRIRAEVLVADPAP